MGLADSEIQKDVLSHAEADEMDLEKLLKFIEGKESGLASQGLMSGGTSVAALKKGWQGLQKLWREPRLGQRALQGYWSDL